MPSPRSQSVSTFEPLPDTRSGQTSQTWPTRLVKAIEKDQHTLTRPKHSFDAAAASEAYNARIDLLIQRFPNGQCADTVIDDPAWRQDRSNHKTREVRRRRQLKRDAGWLMSSPGWWATTCSTEDGPLEVAIRTEELEKLEEFRKMLLPDAWELLYRKIGLGHSYEKLSQDFGVPENTLKQRMHRLKKRFPANRDQRSSCDSTSQGA